MRFPLVHDLTFRPRLLVATLVGLGMYWLLPERIEGMARLLSAWDAAAALYIGLVGWMMGRADAAKIRFRAARQDEGGMAILALSTLSALVSLAAIIAELSTAKSLHGHAQAQHIALSGLTVFLSWTFMHAMFALHYAHEYYSPGGDNQMGGLEFPGHGEPDYWDFVYYSFIIGTACATADVNILSPLMRRLTTLHCVVSFFFNTTILALTVNIGAGLVG